MTYKRLIEQLLDEAIEQNELFVSLRPTTTEDIISYLITCELRKHTTSDEVTEQEAEAIIIKTRRLVIPLVDHFLSYDSLIEHDYERSYTSTGIYCQQTQTHWT